MRPHSNFFSSLKQVEKRLKLDNPIGESSSIPPNESLSSPLYINFEQLNTTTSSAFQDNEPPRQFMSNSFDFPQTDENPHVIDTLKEQTADKFEIGSVDEINLLIRLLGLSDCGNDKNQNEGQNGVVLGFKNGVDDSGFYAKVVGMKGPKCGKEVERMDGWIKHLMSERNREPLRLAHLLLGKFSFISQGDDSFEGLEFPSTIEEFLQNDPPEDIFSFGKKEVDDKL